jgi:hypothetical protein
MTSRALVFVSLALVACGSSGKSGSPGNGGNGGAGGSALGGAGGQAGTSGPTGGAAGGASGGDGCAADAATATCFQHGTWQIDNLSPCFFTLSGDAGTSEGAISTVQNGQQFECPSDFSVAPADTWSTDTLTTDCVGHYTLCYTLKAGSAASPQANDCVVAQACAENDYTTANQPQPWPDLPGWLANGAQTECAKTFTESGGYGEKSVSGTPTGCSAISKVLGTVAYCPLGCDQPNPPAACAGCLSGPTDGGF